MNIPKQEEPLVAGFTTEVVFEDSGRAVPAEFPAAERRHPDRADRGVAGVVGCNNPKMPHDAAHLAMVQELIRNDVLVVQTGCSAIACAKGGLLTPEAAAKFAGKGLDGDLPGGRHSARAARRQLRGQLANPHRLRRDGPRGRHRRLLRQAAGGRRRARVDEREGDCHRHVLRGQRYFRGHRPVAAGGREPARGGFAHAGLRKAFGATWAFEPDPIQAAHLMIDHIDRKRADLGLPLPMYPVPYAPKTVEAAAAAS